MKPHKARTWLATVLLVVVMVHNVVSTVNRFDPDMSDKKILDELLSKRRYDKRLRPGGGGVGGGGLLPPTDLSAPCVTIVNVSVVVLSLSSPDESSLKYEVEFLIHQHWQDPRLAFDDEGRYEYLNGIHHQDDMWVPDTYFVKHGDFKQLLLPANIALRIFKDGVVKYTMRRRLSLSCEGNLNIFPFDDPKCSFAMESAVSYEAHELVYRWKEDDNPPLHFLPSMHTLNAYIISNSTSRCDERLAWRGNYSCLKVHLTFTRDKSFYFSTVFIPGMLLVTSAFITFWLEWNAVPGRVMLGVTTMLNFFTTSNNFRSNLPVVSNLTAMNVWDGVCMCFIYASLLEFVAVNYLGRKKPRGLRCYRPAPTTLAVRPQNMQQSKVDQLGNHDGFSSCVSCPAGACTHVSSRSLPAAPSVSPPPSGVSTAVHDGQQMKVPYLDLAHPLRVAKTIDVVSRVVFPVAYGVFLIFFFVRYNGFS